jgi:predicted DNA-binding WGR domain protein
MLKLYKRVDGDLHYHEAWSSDATIIEHWGKVGTQGEHVEHPLREGSDEDDAIEALLREAREKGFREIDANELPFLIIEFEVTQDGTQEDLAKRQRLEARMNELLGWTGLGHCDGGSIGSGSMEVACIVVDADIAKRVIEDDLAGTEFADYKKMSVQ